MKGYIINNRCYIFPQEVGQLPSIDAEIIYVQEEDIKAWKEANVGVADKIKKYNYNVITVNPKEWTGHKDDELGPVQTYHNISTGGEGIETISAVSQATAGETVTVTLADPGTYTFDLANKEKQRIWVNPYDPDKEYHQEVDNYTFTMPDNDVSIIVDRYIGYTLTVTVDGQTASSIEEVRFLGLHDNSKSLDITDLTDVCRGSDIQINLGEGYTFDTSLTNKIIVTAKFNGTNLEGNEGWAIFNMPSENSTLEITTTPVQTPQA